MKTSLSHLSKTKVLIVGDWHSDIYEKPLYDAFKNAGLDVSSFKWFNYFIHDESKYSLTNKARAILKKIQFGQLERHH